MSEVITSHEQEFLPISEVFTLRALALGVVGKQSRRWLDKPKTSGFAMLETKGDAMGSGSLERYVGVIAKKLTYDYWQMTISFRETRLSEETRYSNVLIQNRFNWNKEGRCVGTRIFRATHAEVPEGEASDSRSLIRSVHDRLWHPLHAEDVQDVREELLEVSKSIDTNRLRGHALRQLEVENE